MTLNPAASQKEPENADTQEFMRMINDARSNGLSQASGTGFGQIQLLDADDQSNPDQALIDNPHVNVADQLGAAAFDFAVRGAVTSKFGVQIQNKQFHDEFSMTGGDGSLKKYFEQMFEDVDENGKKKEDEWDGYVEAHERIREQREEQEREEWSRTRHSFANVELTGQEWGELSASIKKEGAERDWLVQYLMRDGKTTQAEAEQQADELAEAYAIMNKPDAQRTEADQDKLDKAEQNPRYQQVTQALAEHSGKSLNAVSNVEQTSNTASQAVSVSTRATAFEIEDTNLVSVDARSSLTATAKPNDFPTAPNLQAHMGAALAATEPLDAVKTPSMQVAAAPAPGSGFDV